MVDVWKTVKPFAVGGTAGIMATAVIQPLDMVRFSSFVDACLFAHPHTPYHRSKSAFKLVVLVQILSLLLERSLPVLSL